MTNISRRTLLGSAALSCITGVSHAQNYPTKPITWLVGAAAGGGADFITRKISTQMAVNMGSPILVDNRPSSNGFIVATAGKNAAPDGYTVLSAHDGIMINNMGIYGNKLPYDPEKDFIPVSMLNVAPIMLIAHPSFAASDLKSFVALAKSTRPPIQYACVGKGTPHHIAMELLKRNAGFDAEDVQYKGGAPAVQDLLGGQIQVMSSDPITAAPLLKSGKIKALALLHTSRLPAFPNVPTAAEQGYPGLESAIWLGMFAPAGTPKEFVARLSAEVKKALDDPKIAQAFSDIGTDPVSSTPEHFASFIASERARKVAFVRSLRIAVD